MPGLGSKSRTADRRYTAATLIRLSQGWGKLPDKHSGAEDQKKRTFIVPLPIYQYIYIYCSENGIGKDKVIFPITVRAVQKHLQKVVDYLGYENVGTHSFRKFFATDLYEANGRDIELVRELLQHSSTVTTQRYIKRSSQQVEDAIQKHIFIV